MIGTAESRPPLGMLSAWKPPDTRRQSCTYRPMAASSSALAPGAPGGRRNQERLPLPPPERTSKIELRGPRRLDR
jgi:hypothetical protein